MINATSRFFATRIFGPGRHSYLSAVLEAAKPDDDAGVRTAKERTALEQAISAISQRQARLIRTLADGTGHGEQDVVFDPEQEKEFRAAIRQEHATLGAQRKALAEQLARLNALPATDDAVDPSALLDVLPHLDVDLSLVPEKIQRRLYAAFGLEVRYSRPREEITLRVTIPGHMVDGLVSVTRELEPWNKNRVPAPRCWNPIMALGADNPGKADASVPILRVPPAGFEPAHTAPEAVALSPELRGLRRCCSRRRKEHYQLSAGACEQVFPVVGWRVVAWWGWKWRKPGRRGGRGPTL